MSVSVPDGAVRVPGFDVVFRADRADGKRGGGVLLLVRDGLRCSRRADLEVWTESVRIEVRSQSARGSFIVSCLYRPPTADPQALGAALEDSMDKILLSDSFSDVVVVGDFNATSPAWCATDSYNAAGRLLEPVFLQLGLHQCMSTPTHLSSTGNLGALLDVVLVSNAYVVSCVSTHPPLGKSDHLAVSCQLVASKRSQRLSCSGWRIWCYDKADFPKII